MMKTANKTSVWKPLGRSDNRFDMIVCPSLKDAPDGSWRVF
jgi:hypothetical protein